MDFLSRYARDFVAADSAEVAAHFAYPLLTISAEAGSASVSVVYEAEWLAVVDRLLSAYRHLGVARAYPLWSEMALGMPRIYFVSVTWLLLDAADTLIYTFDAAYTLVDSEGGTRVTAVAHNERVGLEAALRTPGSGM